MVEKLTTVILKTGMALIWFFQYIMLINKSNASIYSAKQNRSKLFFLNADVMDHALRLLTVKSLLHLHFVIYEFGVEVCVTSLTKHCGCKTVCVHNSDTAI